MKNVLLYRLASISGALRGGCFGLVLVVTNSASSFASDAAPVLLKDRSYAYALSFLNYALLFTKEATECPQGFNDGPREHFKAMFPDGTKRTVVDTALKREIDGWFPGEIPEPFPFREAAGPVGLGMNLDGKVDTNDFTSPAGEKGIDNELFRVLGCIESFRGPDAYNNFYDTKHIITDRYNRTLVELTGLDSLENDDDVTVTLYRGTDRLLSDAAGNTIGFNGIPGGSQRIDMKWGKKYIQTFKGKIVDHVLTTQAADLVLPWNTFGVPTDIVMYDMRMKLDLSADGAAGELGGYLDYDSFHWRNMKSDSTHHQSYGRLASPSVYRAMARLADGGKDPETGKNRGISTSLLAKFTQIFIVRDEEKPVAEGTPASRLVRSAQQ
ncbi:MAG: hypothetical protein AB7I36_20180 [Rhodospirillaceae bacterium]